VTFCDCAVMWSLVNGRDLSRRLLPRGRAANPRMLLLFLMLLPLVAVGGEGEEACPLPDSLAQACLCRDQVFKKMEEIREIPWGKNGGKIPYTGQEGTFSDSEAIQEKNLEKIRGKDGWESNYSKSVSQTAWYWFWTCWDRSKSLYHPFYQFDKKFLAFLPRRPSKVTCVFWFFCQALYNALHSQWVFQKPATH